LITAAWVATFSQAASSAGACLTASPIAAQWGWTIPPGNPQPASDSDGRAIGAPARIPGMPPEAAGGVVDAFTESVDIAPTIAAVTGVTPPADIDSCRTPKGGSDEE
jgi:hypothetical protein